MTSAKLTARRAELQFEAEKHHASMLALTLEIRVTDARLSEIDFAIAAYWEGRVGEHLAACAAKDAAEGPEFKAWVQAEASAAESGAPGAENASAGEFGGQSLGAATDERLDGDTPALGEGHPPSVSESPSTKKPRAPKRDIRGMVLKYVDRLEPKHETPAEIAAALGVQLSPVKAAINHWCFNGRMEVYGGVVLMRTKEPEPQGSVEAGRLSSVNRGESGVNLIQFLDRNPGSTMLEINAAGIPAAEVYRAEKEGVIRLNYNTGQSLYALPEAEAQQSEAAE